MPQYGYKCRDCNAPSVYVASIAAYNETGGLKVCPSCLGENLGRVYDIPLIHMPMIGGYNPSVGGYVHGKNDLREKLHIASEQATERTGIPHDFKPVDMRDTDALGVHATESVDRDNRARHDSGRPTVVYPD